MPTNRELHKQVKELTDENEALSAKLDEIAAISADADLDEEEIDEDANQGEDDDQD